MGETFSFVRTKYFKAGIRSQVLRSALDSVSEFIDALDYSATKPKGMTLARLLVNMILILRAETKNFEASS